MAGTLAGLAFYLDSSLPYKLKSQLGSRIKENGGTVSYGLKHSGIHQTTHVIAADREKLSTTSKLCTFFSSYFTTTAPSPSSPASLHSSKTFQAENFDKKENGRKRVVLLLDFAKEFVVAGLYRLDEEEERKLEGNANEHEEEEDEDVMFGLFGEYNEHEEEGEDKKSFERELDCLVRVFEPLLSDGQQKKSTKEKRGWERFDATEVTQQTQQQLSAELSFFDDYKPSWSKPGYEVSFASVEDNNSSNNDNMNGGLDSDSDDDYGGLFDFDDSFTLYTPTAPPPPFEPPNQSCPIILSSSSASSSSDLNHKLPIFTLPYSPTPVPKTKPSSSSAEDSLFSSHLNTGIYRSAFVHPQYQFKLENEESNNEATQAEEKQYVSITAMQEYSGYSFEELRWIQVQKERTVAMDLQNKVLTPRGDRKPYYPIDFPRFTKHGQAWAYGNGANGQCGNGDRTPSIPVPRCVLLSKVTFVACGNMHTAFLTDLGDVYTCGSGSYGRLGLGDTRDRNVPSCIEMLKGQRVRHIACGNKHTIAVTDSGQVWTWGAAFRGQLGYDVASTHAAVNSLPSSSPSVASQKKQKMALWSRPHPIASLADIQVRFVAAGGNVSAVIACNGNVWTFGDNSVGQLGIGASIKLPYSSEPCLVRPLEGRAICQLCIGLTGHHVMAVSQHGTLYAWGANQYGQLGLGDVNDRHRPTLVENLLKDDRFVTYAACGAAHSVILTKQTEEGASCGAPNVWACGQGLLGKLAFYPTTTNLTRFHRVQNLIDSTNSNTHAIQVATGKAHTIALTAPFTLSSPSPQHKERCWQWGWQDYECIGYNKPLDERPLTIPKCIASFGDGRSKAEEEAACSLVQVACGSAHTVLLVCGETERFLQHTKDGNLRQIRQMLLSAMEEQDEEKKEDRLFCLLNGYHEMPEEIVRYRETLANALQQKEEQQKMNQQEPQQSYEEEADKPEETYSAQQPASSSSSNSSSSSSLASSTASSSPSAPPPTLKTILETLSQVPKARPLHWAVIRGHHHIVKEFLAYHQHPKQSLLLLNAVDDNGETALHLAAKRGNVPSLQALLQTISSSSSSSSSPSSSSPSPLRKDKEQEEEREILDINGKERNGRGMTALHLAVRRRHKDCVRALMNNPDLALDQRSQDFLGRTALHLAVMSSDQMQKEESGFRAQRKIDKVHYYRDEEETKEKLRLLREQGEKRKFGPDMLLALYLVKKAAAIDVTDHAGRTALHCCSLGNAAALKAVAEQKDVFISYAHVNISFTRRLKHELEKYGIRCWMDDGLEAGGDWRGDIGSGILAAKLFIFVLSSASLNSEWCQKELQLAKQYFKPVITIELEKLEETNNNDAGDSASNEVVLHESQQRNKSSGLSATARLLLGKRKFLDFTPTAPLPFEENMHRLNLLLRNLFRMVDSPNFTVGNSDDGAHLNDPSMLLQQHYLVFIHNLASDQIHTVINLKTKLKEHALSSFHISDYDYSFTSVDTNSSESKKEPQEHEVMVEQQQQTEEPHTQLAAALEDTQKPNDVGNAEPFLTMNNVYSIPTTHQHQPQSLNDCWWDEAATTSVSYGIPGLSSSSTSYLSAFSPAPTSFSPPFAATSTSSFFFVTSTNSEQEDESPKNESRLSSSSTQTQNKNIDERNSKKKKKKKKKHKKSNNNNNNNDYKNSSLEERAKTKHEEKSKEQWSEETMIQRLFEKSWSYVLVLPHKAHFTALLKQPQVLERVLQYLQEASDSGKKIVLLRQNENKEEGSHDEEDHEAEEEELLQLWRYAVFEHADQLIGSLLVWQKEEMLEEETQSSLQRKQRLEGELEQVESKIAKYRRLYSFDHIQLE
ncbi:G patch domain-containing protein 8 isoform X3 [Balamuthia mandrillaris]